MRGQLTSTPAESHWDLFLATFKARSNTQPSRIDHVVVDAELFPALHNCTVGVARPESYHLPLELTLLLAAAPPSVPPPAASPLLPAWKWDGGLQDPYAQALQSQPCQAMLADSVAQAQALHHEQASSHFHSAFSTAASTAGLRRRRPGLNPAPALACYPWFDSRCADLRLRFRRTKRLFPNTPEVQLLGRQYQTQLRHSQARHNQHQVVDLSQLLRSNPRKFWQQTCLPHVLLPTLLQHPSAREGFITNLTAPSSLGFTAAGSTHCTATYACQLPKPAPDLV